MTRRHFIAVFIGAVGVVGRYCFGPLFRPPMARSFPIAGARFHSFPRNLHVNDILITRIEKFGEEDCVAILTQSGMSLGYVPRKLVPLFIQSSHSLVTVAKADRHGVPWKRISVTARFT